jgi:hypothetical protein
VNRETTLARAEADRTAADWTGHKRHCERCAYRARVAHFEWLCLDGTRLRDEHLEAARALAESRRLDGEPITGQEFLF